MPAPSAPTPSELRAKEARDARRARRKEREAQGGIRELNIVAMVDVMTIVLVFLLKSYQASAVNVNMGPDLAIPRSTAQLHPQENITVTVSLREVTVNDRKVAEIHDGRIPAAAKEGGREDAFLVAPVHDALKREVDRQKAVARWNPGSPFTGRINLVADRKIPYRTLMEVLYTAGQAELGQYKLMVLRE
jgi:biopolymer transport protein ExbD